MNNMKMIGLGITLGVLITFCSCDTRDSRNEYYPFIETYEVTVMPQQWILQGDIDEIGSYYQYIVTDLPLYDAYYNGIVSVNMYDYYKDEVTQDIFEVQVPLPHTVYCMNDRVYSELYDYDISADGTLALKLYVSDYYTGLLQRMKKTFKISIMWQAQ
ncbi:MAG: hypothetical protein LBG92_11645 [Prevotellaceae bacterium]|jgi:hypothetical protein|nr:hypothetical protein [Prevotellaceae bacterium]